MKKYPKHTDNEIEADMTPMLDIVFIMLIFFIVTTSFVKESGINLNRPSISDNPTIDEIPAIQLKIDQNDVITLDGREIDQRAVGANIERRKAEEAQAAVIIIADHNASTDALIKVVDEARNAGIAVVSVSTAIE